MPFIQVPILGSLNYFSNARGDGSIVLAAAIIAVFCLAVCA